ncbi:hypothetical protein L249_0325 [Ophiocordyceps polyrhachis-furcata BCC 54312]|uniref:Anaphase-promoting complex subunit 4 WD40 domain-containing protein n=1 Tax=Ophiocordyceps polyrhachis-furcata BCC 54312 TaxID=1330021 RepID=A0A367LG10_9HYPO|nr:hypothetical protein L249_0325 [Ophiocordyceps polyrhachis-furcata BCC 54312]
MAGQNSPQVKDNKAQKRKREAGESETKSKRHRHGRRHNQDNANKKPDRCTATASDSLVKKSQDLSHHSGSGWRISKPMGGRILDIDPILTADERFLILLYNTSVQVYNASNSLLIRRIPICSLDASAPPGSSPASITAARLSSENREFIWVACSDGAVYHVDWTVGKEISPTFRTASRTAKAMVVVPFASEGNGEMIIIAESAKDHCMAVIAYHCQAGSVSGSKTIHTQTSKKRAKHESGLHLLEASRDGKVLTGALSDCLFVCVASGAGEGEFSQVQYKAFSFEVPEIITTIDIRMHAETSLLQGNDMASNEEQSDAVDIIVGGARGNIYVYGDVVSRAQSAAKDGISVSKLHWHRKAVHSAKWSRDGNYIISGGSENTLVLWQVDTSKKNFLPHLSGTVENIVVSEGGSSYVVHLDDNSVMVISTAEMEPTAYVSGIQSAVAEVMTPKDLLVKRCFTVTDRVRRPVPAAINFKESSRLHICVGNGRQGTMWGDFSAPLLQTFDLHTFASVGKQALARTRPTEVNATAQGHTIDEPLITHIAFSGDGKWLASVDEWKPAEGDLGYKLDEQIMRERREVYLKFWQVSDGDEPMTLASRINDPHGTSQSETVLGLAANPATTDFATIGSDGTIRLWRPRARKQAQGVTAGDNALFWRCTWLAEVGAGSGRELMTDAASGEARKAQGSIAFSEDGSTLFAAFGAGDSGAVYVIDTASGEVVRMLDGLWSGQLHAISVLSSFLILLSQELRVYDVVSDELRYGIVVPKTSEVHELLQLATDRSSGHFAVALPKGSSSSVGVFHPDDPEPLLVRSIPHRIVSLVSAPSASGFVAIDDVAQVWVVTEGSDPTAVATVQSLQDLRLDGLTEADGHGGIHIGEDEGAESDAEMEDKSGEEEEEEEEEEDDDDDDDDDEGEDVVMDDSDWTPTAVPRQYLADIFDAAPAFAAPSAEEMFYKVVDLLARPVPMASA